MKILDHFALISAQDDGEDSSGRQKLKLLAPAEIARRACDLAAAFYAEVGTRGWLLQLPEYEHLLEVGKAARAERKARA
jgi:hypothetical protein